MPNWLRVVIFVAVVICYPKLFHLLMNFALVAFLYNSFEKMYLWQLWESVGWFFVFFLCVCDMPRVIVNWPDKFRFQWLPFDTRLYLFCIKIVFLWLLIAIPIQCYGLYYGKEAHYAIAASLGLLIIFSGAIATKLNSILIVLNNYSGNDQALSSDLMAALPLDDMSSEDRIKSEGSVNLILANFRKFIEPNLYVYTLRTYLLGICVLLVFLIVFFKWYFVLLGLAGALFVPGLYAQLFLTGYLEDFWFDAICNDLSKSRERYFLPPSEIMTILMSKLTERVRLYQCYLKVSNVMSLD